jgi:undecaprenyl-diphosphatase
MTIWQAIILGIVQGLTEFIPVSSTAHLIFTSRLTNLFAGVEQTLRAERITAVIAVTQLGTLAAVFVYFARDIWNISLAFVRDHLSLLTGGATTPSNSSSRFAALSTDARLGWLIILGSLPIGIIGLLFKDEIEGTFTKNLWVISVMLVVIGVMLWVAERVGTRTRDMEDLGIRDAIVVGFAQVIALVPGASRSGSTIMGGLFVGEKRATAARFSFLLSIPAITASGLLQLKEAFVKLPEGSAVPLVVATIVAGVIGYAAIWFLMSWLQSRSTNIFIVYRVILGVVLLLLLSGGYIDPQDETSSAKNKTAPLAIAGSSMK